MIILQSFNSKWQGRRKSFWSYLLVLLGPAQTEAFPGLNLVPNVPLDHGELSRNLFRVKIQEVGQRAITRANQARRGCGAYFGDGSLFTALLTLQVGANRGCHTLQRIVRGDAAIQEVYTTLGQGLILVEIVPRLLDPVLQDVEYTESDGLLDLFVSSFVAKIGV